MGLEPGEWNTVYPIVSVSLFRKKGRAVPDERDNPVSPVLLVHSFSESVAVDGKPCDHGKVLERHIHLATREMKVVCLRPPMIKQ